MHMTFTRPPFTRGQVGGASRKRPIDPFIAKSERQNFERSLNAVKFGTATNEDVCTLSQLPAFIGTLVKRGVLIEQEHQEAAIEYEAALDREKQLSRFGFSGNGLRLIQKMIDDFDEIGKSIWAHEYMKAWNELHANCKQFVANRSV